MIAKIRQSYHGTGGKEGYRFEVYDENDKKMGNLIDVPFTISNDDVVRINDELYQIVKVYDSPLKKDIRNEVVIYELNSYIYNPNYELGKIIK